MESTRPVLQWVSKFLVYCCNLFPQKTDRTLCVLLEDEVQKALSIRGAVVRDKPMWSHNHNAESKIFYLSLVPLIPFPCKALTFNANDLYIWRTVSPLNSPTTYIYVANSGLKFGGILFTPIRLTAVARYASGPMKVRLSFRSQNVPPPPPKPHHRHWYIRGHLVNAHFSHLTNTVMTLLALTIACSGVHCGLKYQHWPMKRTLVADQKGCKWCTVPI